MTKPIGFLPPIAESRARPMFRTLGIASSGLSAQRVRMDAVATNIANAETTHTASGTPFRRHIVEMGVAESGEGVQVTSTTEDPSEGPLVYDPGHPDANADGYVRYPNVRVTDEVVDLMDARRIYEANATVFQATKSMLHRAIDI